MTATAIIVTRRGGRRYDEHRYLSLHGGDDLPFPSLGHVRQHGEGWQWQPIDTVG